MKIPKTASAIKSFESKNIWKCGTKTWWSTVMIQKESEKKNKKKTAYEYKMQDFP